ncbi:ferritin-like domain-containing protein [Peristeroidobacter agariperforans]|uniref:ferritin-like domain-containing protein n=1 Tax=Peristeroidobacter agariperforans TaxID=268404 RepID=UPI00101CEC20|nr:ferritin-like domain-containing protein [Peristeroidobacter agariperforans]
MPQSTDATRLGINRTGLQMSPQHAKEMLQTEDLLDDESSGAQSSPGDEQALALARQEYIAAADPLGSIPAPATLKGAAKTAAKMLTGRRSQVFIDKLAERLAFERGGARLYDAVCAKAIAPSGDLNKINVDELLEIRDAEARHALMVKECMETLGADPTAQTPCADLAGVESMGLLQAASDPRTTLAQSLHAALAAELIDNEGWDGLIVLARDMGQENMARRFEQALKEEREHLTKVRRWYTQLSKEMSELM